jgi:hypothetical protein
MEPCQVFGDEITAPDRGFGGQPPDPVPEVDVDGRQRVRTGFQGRGRFLALAEEEVLDLGRSGEEDLVDREVAQRLPLPAQRPQRGDQPWQVTRQSVEVRRLDCEVPVREGVVGST